ncbi:hypothetical protein DL89DRAFT_100557 [Linderina pennispora]|uniref:Uncharacterized protein n=1 Tax=Linderina pennispora TaxID=61395 RepID=A0A1Y1VW17_9FUNG|nr:uncharacterized protein DL89DRAFT_100557 [Linderina pennispora]ORX65487.1 hypothetical protein DL89DRAFT_100557 [Linderina pennispora]
MGATGRSAMPPSRPPPSARRAACWGPAMNVGTPCNLLFPPRSPPIRTCMRQVCLLMAYLAFPLLPSTYACPNCQRATRRCANVRPDIYARQALAASCPMISHLYASAVESQGKRPAEPAVV